MKKNQIIGIIIIRLVVITLSLILEVFVFNWNFFAQGSKKQEITEITTSNLEILENGHYRILDDEASIQMAQPIPNSSKYGTLRILKNCLDIGVTLQR